MNDGRVLVGLAVLGVLGAAVVGDAWSSSAQVRGSSVRPGLRLRPLPLPLVPEALPESPLVPLEPTAWSHVVGGHGWVWRGLRRQDAQVPPLKILRISSLTRSPGRKSDLYVPAVERESLHLYDAIDGFGPWIPLAGNIGILRAPEDVPIPTTFADAVRVLRRFVTRWQALPPPLGWWEVEENVGFAGLGRMTWAPSGALALRLHRSTRRRGAPPTWRGLEIHLASQRGGQQLYTVFAQDAAGEVLQNDLAQEPAPEAAIRRGYAAWIRYQTSTDWDDAERDRLLRSEWPWPPIDPATGRIREGKGAPNRIRGKGATRGSAVRPGPRLRKNEAAEQAAYVLSEDGLAARRIAVAHRLMQAVRRRVSSLGREERWGPNGIANELWTTLWTSDLIPDDKVPCAVRAVSRSGHASEVTRLLVNLRSKSGLSKKDCAGGQTLLDAFPRWKSDARIGFRMRIAPEELRSLETFEVMISRILGCTALHPEQDQVLRRTEDWVRAVEEADRAEGYAIP